MSNPTETGAVKNFIERCIEGAVGIIDANQYDLTLRRPIQALHEAEAINTRTSTPIQDLPAPKPQQD